MHNEHTLCRDIYNLIEETSAIKVAAVISKIAKKRALAGKSLIPYNPIIAAARYKIK
jgi:hypothetical protein